MSALSNAKSLPVAMALALVLAPLTTAADDATPWPIAAICASERDGPPAGAKRELVRVDGVGTGGFAISAAKPEAQAWFDYGMALAHAFYHADATAAFQRARQIDPTCAMCAWGEAWSVGPTINFDVDPKVRASAKDLIKQAAKLATGESRKNRDLFAALDRRYDGPAARGDLAFAQAMDELARRYPQDDEIAVMTSDAWLIVAALHDDNRGSDRAVSVLQPVLARHPDNTAAIHFYIHATEMAGKPALALPYADRLGALAPGASHLVHMASHTFFRVGRYEDAATANAQALAVDAAYLRAAHDASHQGAVPYHSHDLRFGLAGALLAGDARLAVRFADHAAFAFPPPLDAGPGGQFAAASAAFAFGRYAPDRALRLPDPGVAQPYASALRRYARGEAFAAKGDAANVRGEAAALEAQLGKIDASPSHPKKTARSVTRIAALTLRGRAAMLEGRPADAVKAYRAAATIQDAELSGQFDFDPPPWWYPERRSLAAAFLAAGKPKQAMIEARAALARWPHDPLTLRVLSLAESALGNAAAAERDGAEATRGWRGGDVPLARI